MSSGERGGDRNRCPWPKDDEQYRRYHDEEWGVPVHDDRRLFEMLVLEGAQAGLSWKTILDKRPAYRRAYAGFDPEGGSRCDSRKVRRLLADPGIVRNRLKILSSIRNARLFLEIQEEAGSFDAYLWAFVAGHPVVNRFRTPAEIPARTELSDRISKDLRRRGFSFVGSTILYAYLQAVGVVNDHLVSCFRHAEVLRVPSTRPRGG